MINLLLSILFLGCVVLIIKLWSSVHHLKAEYLESDAKAKFWEKQFKIFSKDEAINKEIILRKKYERLYHNCLDELDKLKDKRQFNGNKHEQRTRTNRNNIK